MRRVEYGAAVKAGTKSSAPANVPEPATSSIRSRLKGFVLGTALVLTIFASWLLLVPAPRAVIPWVMAQSSGWLLSGYERDGSLPTRATRKFVGLWLQQGLAYHAYKARPGTDPDDDADKIIKMLIYLKPMFISQAEQRHGPANSPVAVSGLAWCDPTNGFAANVLSHEFPRSEVVGGVDRQARAGHAFGRVWSEQYDDWLYFDLWTDEVVVFRSRSGGKAEYLRRARPLGARSLSAEDPELIGRIYDNAHSSFTQFQAQPTLAAYLISRVGNLVQNGSTSPEGTLDAIATAATIAPPNNRPNPQPTEPAARAAYLQARFYHLIGNKVLAREAYHRVMVAEKPPFSGYHQAARTYFQRLNAPEPVRQPEPYINP